VICKVLIGGKVSNNKGLSLPGMNLSVPALSAADIVNLEFALRLGVDFVALSFVRSADDLDLVHNVMDRVGRRVPVIAKIEKPEAVDAFEAIVSRFDAVMVARGDLGVELPLEDVPLVQKRIIQLAREHAKPVIVATQMLESMIENSRPTRAEVSDVANAVLDGADAVMLSAETSVGKHAVDAVATMARIVERAEQPRLAGATFLHVPRTKPGVLSYAARDIGETTRRQGSRRLHPVRRHSATAREAALLTAGSRVHLATGSAKSTFTILGYGDIPCRACAFDRRNDQPSRRRSLRTRSLRPRRPRHHRCWITAKYQRFNQPDPRASHWRAGLHHTARFGSAVSNYSQRTSSGALSGRSPRQLGWRRRPSDVRSL
jgi:hypothetical protein